MAAIAMAASLVAGTVHAQSTVSLYGTLDVAVDQIRKDQGNVQGTLFAANGAPATRTTRMSTSLTRVSHIGFKGSEDLGGGWLAKFQLDGGLAADNGMLGNDGRMFGRMAWVGLQTPVGEFRVGRQASPLLFGYYINSLEQLGSTDLIGAGATVNNLQIYQDNVISYGVAKSGWVAQLSYSPNAGVASRVSAARAPLANENTGQITGGATAGTETSSGRGRTTGAVLAYVNDSFSVVAAFHRNTYGVPFGLATPAGYVPLFQVKDFNSHLLGGKYTVAATGTQLAANYYRGKFTEAGGKDPRISVYGLAAKQTLGTVDLIAQYVTGRFDNFTRGKDTGWTLGAEYSFSKRTTLYTRYARVTDKRGDIVRASATPLPIAGGPLALLLPLGTLEVPVFSGAGTSMDASSQLLGVGIRHSF